MIKNTSVITKDESDQIDMNLSIDLDMIRNPGKYWEAMKNLPKNSLDVAQKVWASPNTILGLAYGGAGYLYSHIIGDGKAEITFGNNAVQFAHNPLGLGGAGLSLGNAISYFDKESKGKVTIRDENYNTLSYRQNELYGQLTHPDYDNKDKVNLGKHERKHTYQAEYLGPLYLATWLFSGGPSSNNWMERQADEAGRNELKRQGIYKGKH